ncbi:adenosylmethionine decarboxylase [Nocardioides jensenii]|uniref:adenosylmethionine decarboxylase n=1 Tax=Nocardioides jensenii TaxID=1843 RepID=UPI00082BA685|nr:adenosylmethionine decarboxylase [Nocardioides jensenii]
MNYSFLGTHVLADIYDIDDLTVRDNALVLEALRKGIRASNATLCDVSVKEFDPAGMTAMFLLAESHVAVHTYPDAGSLFVDAFTCGTTCQPTRIIEELVAVLGPVKHRMSVLQRGLPAMAGGSRLATPVGAAAVDLAGVASDRPLVS